MPRTWVVDQGGGGDFTTVTEACDAAASGDSVLISPGDYDEWEEGTSYISLQSKALSLLGSGSSPETVTLHVQLSCPDSDIALENLRISDVWSAIGVGSGNLAMNDCLFENVWGLMHVGTGSASIRNCRFEGNYASAGGAMEISSGELLVEESTFVRNRATDGGGGAILAGNPIIRRCLFVDNTAARGGAVLAVNSIQLQDCVFFRNEAPNGAAVTVGSLRNSVFERCTFLNNRTGPEGATIEIYSGGQPIKQCIVAGTVNGYGLGTWDTAWLQCCDFWDNDYGNTVGWVGWDDYGNFSADPLFCDVLTGDVGLTEGSPCFPGEHDGVECELIGARGLGCGIVATRQTSWGRLKLGFR